MAEYTAELIRGTSHTLMGVGKFVRGKAVKVNEDIKRKLEKAVEVVTQKDNKGKSTKKHLPRFRFVKLGKNGQPVKGKASDVDEAKDVEEQDTDGEAQDVTTEEEESGDEDTDEDESEEEDETDDDDDIAEVEGDEDEDELVQTPKTASKKAATKSAKKKAKSARDR